MKMFKNLEKNFGIGCVLFAIILFILGAIGEVRCIIKAFNCNWEPIGKAEVIYTGAAITGLGSIAGWINIEDK